MFPVLSVPTQGRFKKTDLFGASGGLDAGVKDTSPALRDFLIYFSCYVKKQELQPPHCIFDILLFKSGRCIRLSSGLLIQTSGEQASWP